ncbi:MAG: right-handed parallel beta-helix repeat-containing protein, partial [Roseiflexaceae bacterium]
MRPQRDRRGYVRWMGAILMLSLLTVHRVSPVAHAATGPTYAVGPDEHDQTTITVAGQGAVVTLHDIQQGLGTSAALLESHENGVWQLNANLLIDRGVTLNLTDAAGVRELRLRSQANATTTAVHAPQLTMPTADSGYNYASFVYVRTNDGTITIDGVKLYSWDPALQAVDTDITNGRSYLLAKYAAQLNISRAELSYLGSGDGESYGVSWRDTNDLATPSVLRTRVSGQVSNSFFHHNYYGIYTFQASNMVFRNNIFAHNIRYGFDPHDYSHHFLVEDNEAFANGSHGFIISRGCHHFEFRRNRSHDNDDPDPVKLAHGFMLDPGSPDSLDPQAPSTQNLLEENAAYGNEGYGLRVLGSTSNTIQNNRFQHNMNGITVEISSTGNILMGNTVTDNQANGIFIRGGANQTTVTKNSVVGNGTTGIYIKSNDNIVQDNTVQNNQAAGVLLLPETDTAAAIADLTVPAQHARPEMLDPDLVQISAAAGVITGNVVHGNAIASNADAGIALNGATATLVELNVVERNGGHGIALTKRASRNQVRNNTVGNNRNNGIRVDGVDAVQNTLTQNSVFANATGGVLVTSGANGGLTPPVIQTIQGRRVSGIATPGTSVEIFSDTGRQGRYSEG